MTIKFTDQYLVNSEFYSVIFMAIVDGNSVGCHIRAEALQDIDPQHRLDKLDELYLNNIVAIQSLATRLIMKGRLHNGQLHISNEDMKTM